jgi:GTPase
MTRSGTVALLGRPNCGKSTLVNALVGAKVAIVSDKPQTTRHRVVGVLNDERGQALLFDLPGVHRPLHRMNVRMMHILRDTLREVDVVLQLCDASQAPGAGEAFVIELLRGLEAAVVLVPNKIDLPQAQRGLQDLLAHYTARHAYAAVNPASALTGAGLADLTATVFRLLPEGGPLVDPALTTTQSERFLITELIREALLARVGKELPFVSAVAMRAMEEEETARGPLLRLWADIVVEAESQKAIVVGRGGRMIREIGTAGRESIERLLGARVYLDLRVKARPGWRENQRFLVELDPLELPWPLASEGEDQ